jgi:hypothetical protein
MRTTGALLVLVLAIRPVFSQSLLAAPGAAGAAQIPAPASGAKPDLTAPKDKDSAWLIGFSVFTAEGLSTENAYLAYSLPLLLKDAASALAEHALTDEERNLVARAAVDRELAAADAAITAARNDRSALAFSDVPATDASRAAADARVAAALARRDYLAALDPALVEVPAAKPVKVKEGSGAGLLLDAPSVPQDAYCARQGVEMLIGGSLREVQGYLLLDVWAYDAIRAKIVYSWRNAAQRDELYGSVGSLSRELASAILGRAWSLVVFSPTPKQAALFVDGNLVVTGASPGLYLSPGFHDVRISAAGYADSIRQVTFEEGAETRVEDVLLQSIPGTIAVSTDPPGADLYVDSVWKGKTPLVMDIPAVRSRGLLMLDGYYDRTLSVSPSSPATLSYSLQMDTGPLDAQQKRARDEFYASFAWFALSMPIPLFSIAFQNDYAAWAYVPAVIFTGTYYAGVAISVGLFSWMVSRIIHYVIVSNGTAG